MPRLGFKVDFVKLSRKFLFLLYTTRGGSANMRLRRSLCARILWCFLRIAETFGTDAEWVRIRFVHCSLSGSLALSMSARLSSPALFTASSIIFAGYFCFRRASFISAQLALKSSLFEHIRLKRWACLYGMPVLQFLT